MLRSISKMLCVFFYMFLAVCFCTPCASLPDGLMSESSIIFSEILFTCLLPGSILIFLLSLGQVFILNARFVPFNVSLNVLRKQHRNNYNFFDVLASHSNFIFILACLSHDKATFVVFTPTFTTLDSLCLGILWRMIMLFCTSLRLGFFLIKILIFCNYKKVLRPWCDVPDLTAFWLFNLLLILSSDVHPNPGPSQVSSEFSSGFLSFCNWNLNTLSKDNFCRVSLLEAHNTIFNYDIISLCETSLSDDTPVPENILPGYLYQPLNHPEGRRSGGVGIFYKQNLPLRARDDLSFDECLVCELNFGRKKIFSLILKVFVNR